MVYTDLIGGDEGVISITEEVPKEGFQVENFAVEDVEMFEVFDDGFHCRFCFFHGDRLFTLDLLQELVQVINRHQTIF